MDKKNIEAIYPLTPMQQILLLHAIQHPKQDLGFLQIQFDMRGTVDVIALRQAWQSLFNRHQVLRTAIYWEDLDQPLQVVLRQVAPIWQQLDWQQLTPEQQQQRLSKWCLEDQQQGLSLNQAPVMRLTLIQQAADHYHFVCSCHHILLDGWSGYLMMTELFQLYQAHLQGTAKQLPAAFNYQQYVNWIQQQSLESAKIFWQQQLKGLSKTTAWPIKVANAKAVYAKQTQTMSRSLTKQLQQLCRQEKMTLNTFLQGIWSLLLDGYSEQQDIVFGITLSGRTAPFAGIERAIGMFMNVLPLRVKINHHDQLLPWLQSIAAQQVQISHYEYVALSQIQTWCATNIRSLFVFENYGQPDLFNNDSLSITNFKSGLTTNYPLTIAIQPGEQLVFSIIYDTNYLSTEQVTKLLEDWQKLLTESIAQPQRQLFALLQQIEVMAPKRLKTTDSTTPQKEKTLVRPQTLTEEMLARIWIDILGIESFQWGSSQINIHDNFFDIGGHSLFAARLLEQVRKVFQVKLPLHRLFEFTTIAKLAKCIETEYQTQMLPSQAKAKHWSFLVPIQPGGEKRPFFIVPGGGGGEDQLMISAKLVYLLGQEQPVYGLQAHSSDGEQVPHTQVETMATEYIKEIRTIQPNGPYLLGGECIGGLVAFEMAQQLQAQGHKVGLLLLLDTIYPSRSSYFTYLVRRILEVDKIKHRWKILLELDLQEQLPYFFDKAKKAVWRFIVKFNFSSVPLEHQAQHVKNKNTYLRTLMRYRPKPYSGRMVLLATGANYEKNSTLGWETLVTGGMKVYRLSGDHSSYLGKHVHATAQQLKACLDEAQTEA